MATDLASNHLDQLALRRTRAKLGWYQHAAIYLIVNTGLALLAISQGRHWAVFPLLGWGLGLALHGARVWLVGRGSAVFERMVAKERAALAAARSEPW